MSLMSRLFGIETREATAAAASPDSETIRRIAHAMDSLEPDRARFVAAFAFILSRVARADLKISEQETREMERLVAKVGGLPEEQAVMAVQIAKAQNTLFGATDNFIVTDAYNKTATPEQKRALLRCLFAVSAADESVSSVEEHVIKEIARELQLTHDDYIAARLEFRKYLAVLKEPGENKG